MFLKKKNKIVMTLLILFLGIINCSKKNDDKNTILELTSSQLQNEVFYYDDYFVKSNITKKSNFLTREEILKAKNESFFYLYKIEISNNKAKVLFLRIRSGQMFEYILKKENNNWNIFETSDYITKVETNDGTKLFWEVHDNLKNK